MCLRNLTSLTRRVRRKSRRKKSRGTPVNVKLLRPPLQSRGNSQVCLRAPRRPRAQFRNSDGHRARPPLRKPSEGVKRVQSGIASHLHGVARARENISRLTNGSNFRIGIDGFELYSQSTYAYAK
jgi:hypothetical protein